MFKDKAKTAVLLLALTVSVSSLSIAYYYYDIYHKAINATSQSVGKVDEAQADITPDVKANENASQKYNKEILSPAVILSKYITALKAGDNKMLNSLLSSKYIAERTAEGKGYPEFPPQKISDVLIMVNDYERNDLEEANYILQFVIDKESEPVFYYEGENYYFMKLIYEDNMWKINHMATSP